MNENLSSLSVYDSVKVHAKLIECQGNVLKFMHEKQLEFDDSYVLSMFNGVLNYLDSGKIISIQECAGRISNDFDMLKRKMDHDNIGAELEELKITVVETVLSLVASNEKKDERIHNLEIIFGCTVVLETCVTCRDA